MRQESEVMGWVFMVITPPAAWRPAWSGGTGGREMGQDA